MNFQRGSERFSSTPADTMPGYFLITVMLRDKSVHKGIRKHESGDINSCFLLFKGRAEDGYGRDNIIYFQCVQLSKHSDEVKGLLTQQAAKHGLKKAT